MKRLDTSRDGDAFVVARLHSHQVRLLKKALPIIAIAIALIFSWFTFFVAPPSADIITLNGAFGSSNKLVMMQPKVEGYNRNRQPYALSAARAIQDPARNGLIELEDIAATLPLGKRGAAHIQARGGIFDNVNGRMLLDKPFQIETDTGIRALFLSADVDIPSSQLVSNERVEIHHQSETLTAQHLRILDHGQVFVFEGGVRLTITAQEP